MTKHSADPSSREQLAPSDATVRIATALTSPSVEAAAPPAESVQALIQQRALRLGHLPGELLSDPAWDMLLELFHAELTCRRLVEPVLYKAAGLSVSLGSRWVEVLVSNGLCARSVDPRDDATVFVTLSAKGHQAMCGYFATLQSVRKIALEG